ncbi:MAG: hypothetical protein JNK73_13100 [Bacteroidia bacterium]|nr:hypothetical protein [Bacteroidia bacterium]
MKKAATILLMFFNVLTFAQNTDSLAQEAEYQKLKNTMRPLGNTRSQFSNVPYNFVSSRLQTYMNNEMNMYVLSDDLKNNQMTLVFEEKASYSGPAKKLKFEFSLYSLGNFFYIKDCKISGDKSKVVVFFIEYWRQNIHEDTLKEDVYKTMCLEDDVVLSMKPNPSIKVFKRATADK